MKKGKKGDPEGKKSKKDTEAIEKAKQAPVPEQDREAHHSNGVDAKAIKALSEEVASQGKMLKEMQKELRAMSSHLGVK